MDLNILILEILIAIGVFVVLWRAWDVPNIKKAVYRMAHALHKHTNIANQGFDEEMSEVKGLTSRTNILAESPLQLTETGREKLEKSGLKDVIDENENILIRQVKEQGDQTKFDIRLNSAVVIKEYLKENHRIQNTIKGYAYEEGISNLMEFAEIGGIYLRDLYISKASR